jgi:uncharacterized protein (TIGR03437 family)
MPKMGVSGTLAFLLASTAAARAQSFTFNPGAVYPAGSGPLVTAQGDFNGDGNLDIAVGNAASNNVSIYLGKGDGTFTPGATVAVPGCLVGFLAAGDFNRDGHTDLFAACLFQTSVFVLPGTGNGKFGAPISTGLANLAFFGFSEGNFQDIAIADFNNDGVPDLLIALVDNNLDSASISLNLMLGQGNGTFQAPQPLVSSATFLPTAVMVADFDRDGNQDIAVAGETAGSNTPQLEIFLGTGQGTFQTLHTFAVPVISALGSATIADLNRDGLPDIILVGAQPANNDAVEMCVFLGIGGGAFKLAFTAPESSTLTPVGVVAADLSGTGNFDLAEIVGDLTDASNSPVSFTLQVRPGNGDGTFGNPTPMAFPPGLGPWPTGMLAGYFTSNGLVDLVFAALPSPINLSNQTSSDGVQNALDAFESLPAGDLVVILNGTALAPALSVSASELQFSYVPGGAAPARQSVTISNTGTGTLNWTASTASPWLAVSPASGQAPASLSIAVLPGSLTPATYTGTVLIAAAGATGRPQTITATLTVSLSSGAPVITGVVNGASFQPGFESGSWVTIQGSNLSNTNPGRTWTSSEIVNGNLPTSLDNTSVTIDGRPAYVYYISPTQLNVQAPTDSNTGSVAVVVTNNGQPSAAFNAQLSTYSPAFFLYSGSSYAIAQHYPDNALVGNPNAIAGTIAAHPGDVLILWATGFGPTSPLTPAGIVVTGAPAVAQLPTVTVGGVQVDVINAVLSPGSAGLYQVAVQLPASVPTGVVAVQASAGGAISPAGISLYVSGQ